MVFARTSKALTRMNVLFATNETHKIYWAVVEGHVIQDAARLTHYLVRNTKQNKSYAHEHAIPQSKRAVLSYRVLQYLDRYTLLEIHLETGRHHQIRAQLAKMGYVIKGDLKYGAKRSNPDGSIHLLARKISFTHPVSKEPISIVASVPQNDTIWQKVITST